MRNLTKFSAAACAAVALTLAVAGTAMAQPAAQPTATIGHILQRSGPAHHLAVDAPMGVATTGVVAGPFTAGSGFVHEDFQADHEPGAGFPGGRFGFFYAPAGVQTNLYIHTSTDHSLLETGAPAATIWTAGPLNKAGYGELIWLKGGTVKTNLVLTNLDGQLGVRTAPHGPSAAQLWKVTEGSS